jgi:hypothetical protein
MLNINPTTAVLLLDGFLKLNREDRILFNAANSQVARCIIAMAVPRPLTVVVSDCPFEPVTVVELLPAQCEVDRVAVWPFGPVVVAVTSPVPRPVTVRLAVAPLGPVTALEWPRG